MYTTRKLLVILVFTCAASFSQQLSSTSKPVTQVSSAVTVTMKDDSQKQLKKAVIVRKTPTTWTKIKDLFM